MLKDFSTGLGMKHFSVKRLNVNSLYVKISTMLLFSSVFFGLNPQMKYLKSGTAQATVENQKGKTVQIVSMNIHCLNGDWVSRVSQVLDEVIKLSPEVINFQEVCRGPKGDQISFITDYLIKHGYPLLDSQIQFTHMAWDVDAEYLATFTKVKPDAVQLGALPPSPLPRGYIALKIFGQWIINVHLEYSANYWSYRKEQIHFLVERFKGSPHLMIGDYNSYPKNPEHAELWQSKYLPFFANTRNIENTHKQFFSYDLDGVWISPEFQNQTLATDFHIILDDPHKHLSDHFGILFQYVHR